MSKEKKLFAAADLADRYIETVLSEEPRLLIDKVADQSAKDIARSAKALAEFRHQLIKALAEQPLPDLYEERADVAEVVSEMAPEVASGNAASSAD